MMELNCYMGQPHAWRPTWAGYYTWHDNTTSVPHPPEDAPYYAEQKCWRCGATRHVTTMPPNAEELADALYAVGYKHGVPETAMNYDPRGTAEWQAVADAISVARPRFVP